MKHLVQKAFLMICLALPVLAMGQIDPKNYGKSADFKTLGKRTLAVVLMEEDEKTVEKLEKKNKTEELSNYRQAISNYNTSIKEAVAKNWKLNQNVEYITQEEAKDLRKSKSTKYAFMELVTLSGSGDWSNISAEVPVIQYTRSEKHIAKPDIKQFVPSTGSGSFSEAEFKLALMMMQRQIDEYSKSGKTNTYYKWAKENVEANCANLKNYTVFFSSDHFTRGVKGGELKSEYPNPSRVLSRKEIDEKIMNPAENEAVFVVVPWGIANSSMGPISTSMAANMKVAVNPATGEIVGGSVPGSSGGVHMVDYYVKKDFKEMLKCK